MSEEKGGKSKWLYTLAEVRGWLQFGAFALGAVAVFYLVDWPRAERESENAATPRLVMTPTVRWAPPDRDVSELQCEMKFENVGAVDVRIRQVDVKVYNAWSGEEMRNVIQSA